ncbi:DedA family protein [Salinicola sp. LHM]|uniref:DedA family protein n=1 Tax=Salinicola TaxID=404432 RepID=UPI000DA1C3C2|nr:MULTISPECIES: DedA family protein [Salinicola]MEC8918252.1 DedA family protein [Pseudomonadota bacterium]MED5499501.1 DedA family protein [Pseudomonadota bacterium]WQH32496.1 DedA family protein [Salinicola sp. LHM]
MYSLIQQAVDTLSYFGLVLLMFAENLFPPIPSELIMPLAGYLSSQGKLSLIGAIVAGTVGSVLGALPFYGVARWFGHDRMSAFVERHGHWLALSRRDLDRADRIFKRHGGWIVLFGRLVPGVRSLISLPAGVYAMPIGRFLLLTASGSAIWSAFLAVAGYQLAENFRALEAYIGPASKLVLGLLVLAWLYHIGKHYWRRRHG